MCSDMHMKPARVAFPLLLSLPVALSALLVWRGVAGPLALTVATVTLLLVATAIERWRPFRASWNTAPRAELGTDLAYIALASVPDRLSHVVVEAAGVALVGAVAVQATSTSSWSTDAWAVGLAAFVVADLGKYLLHRASHEHPWLWRFHVAHHQPARLVASNALRLHPVNMAYNGATDALVAVAFGVRPEVAAVFATLRAAVGVVQHANIDLEAQQQWLVNAPSYHRLHHAVDVGTANHNFRVNPAGVGSPLWHAAARTCPRRRRHRHAPSPGADIPRAARAGCVHRSPRHHVRADAVAVAHALTQRYIPTTTA
jgi:sterol desaturase/sphingolipid hydroxylase (fatty acid hydroxylase superfamily)